MGNFRNLIILLITLLSALAHNQIKACSMYKLTVDGKTMVGCNHDDWFTTPKIWFRNARKANEYGIACTGAREISPNQTTPQSGMNTAGLVFSRLASYHPTQVNPFTNRLKIDNEKDYLINILHQCATIADVRKHIEQYDHSLFIDGIFIYIDRSGAYLIVEPYELIEGRDPNYILANFCPSITTNVQARKMLRFRNGEDYLKTHAPKSTLDFCTALSDTMHVCRERLGDGTLTTSIWNTQDITVDLFFYHSYENSVQFNLMEELQKGDHSLNIPELFAPNPEFERLVNYKTPSNTIALRILVVILLGGLVLLSLVLALHQIWSKTPKTPSLGVTVLIFSLNMILVLYLIVLLRNKGIFYFDAPYRLPNSILISASSYTPFLLLLLMGPILVYTFGQLKLERTKLWVKMILVTNNLAYLLLMVGFVYWGLFNFWA